MMATADTATGTGSPDLTEQDAVRAAPPGPGLAQRLGDLTARGPVYTFLVVVSVIWLIPTLGLLLSSFRTASANTDSGWWTVLTAPAQLTFQPYIDLIGDAGFVDSVVNTAVITVPTTILVVLLASLAAYAFTWVSWRGRDVAFLVVVGLLVVPLQVGLIPVASLFGQLGIFGSVVGVILFHVAFGLPFAIFLMRNFFAGIPGELLEAARLDGASEVRLFTRVVLPLGLPAIASLAIFQFLWTWNDLLVALVFADQESAPITLFIQQNTRQFGSNIDIIAPGAFISMVIPLAVFFAFQRYFVQGLLAGSSK